MLRLSVVIFTAGIALAQPFLDRRHVSKTLGETRNYRILLPPGYESSGQRYPVIYYFHGHSDRYTVEHYDQGKETIPKMAEFVARNPVIVVCVDGYEARTYTGFYGGDPWHVRAEGGEIDFGEYFRELTAHIDSTYRTLTSRRFRGTSGLSMGGFMSLWLSARYPEIIGSASSFNPGPEFYVGDKGRRLLWRPKDHTANHSLTPVRLIRASGDYISQYHEETREAYARSAGEFEFRQDEYHRHWATSIGETFAFHARAFARSELDNVPVRFSHHSPFRKFSVWDWSVETEGEPAYTMLEDVSQGGLTIRNAGKGFAASVTTAPLYRPGAVYTIVGTRERRTATADSNGRLRFRVSGEESVGIAGPGTGAQEPVVLPVTRNWFWPDREVAIPVRIFNPRGEASGPVKVELRSDYPTVAILAGKAEIADIASGASVDLADRLKVRFTAGDGTFAHARLEAKITYDGWHTSSRNIDIEIAPSVIEEPAAWVILDGRTRTFAVFRQAGNRGGGAIIEREVTEGKGNGNGKLEPGEEATIWVKHRQGLDPFDKGTWHRARVFADSGSVEEVRVIEEEKQREWTGAKERTSVIRLAAKPESRVVLLATESWAFEWTPDAKYGNELLYQAFQRHRSHLARVELRE